MIDRYFQEPNEKTAFASWMRHRGQLEEISSQEYIFYFWTITAFFGELNELQAQHQTTGSLHTLHTLSTSQRYTRRTHNARYTHARYTHAARTLHARYTHATRILHTRTVRT